MGDPPKGGGGESHILRPCYEPDYTPVMSYTGIWANLKGPEAQKLSSGFPVSPSYHTQCASNSAWAVVRVQWELFINGGQYMVADGSGTTWEGYRAPAPKGTREYF